MFPVSHPPRLLAEIRTVSVSLAAIDCAEKAGSRFELAEMNDFFGLVLHFSGDSGTLRESRAALERLPAFEGKRVEIVCTALGGYKQPQQLFSLMYFLALGGHFDVWVNLDGFNLGIDSMIYVTDAISLSEHEIEEHFIRAPGPGGQPVLA